MTREEIRVKFAEIVEVSPAEVADETPLESLAAWDSVAMVSFVALADEAGVKLQPKSLRSCSTVGQLFDAAGVSG